MSFETITIERRQPIIDKRLIRIPGGEAGGSIVDGPVSDFGLPPVTISEAEIAIDTPTNGDDGRMDVLSFGRGREYKTIHPYYTQNLNMDFVVYDVIGLDGKRVATGEPDDMQEALREVARAKF